MLTIDLHTPTLRLTDTLTHRHTQFSLTQLSSFICPEMWCVTVLVCWRVTRFVIRLIRFVIFEFYSQFVLKFGRRRRSEQDMVPQAPVL